jgi:hypothetical protein
MTRRPTGRVAGVWARARKGAQTARARDDRRAIERLLIGWELSGYVAYVPLPVC